MASDWYMQIMGETIGPLSSSQLKERAAAGQITRDVLVRRGSSGRWALAAEVNGLFTSQNTGAIPSPGPELESVTPNLESTPATAIAQSGRPGGRRLLIVCMICVVVPIAAFGIFSIWNRIRTERFRPELFDGVHRAARNIEGATAIGVNRSDFHTKLAELSGEIKILSDRVTSEREKQVFESYKRTLEAYVASEMLWDAQFNTKRKIASQLWEQVGIVYEDERKAGDANSSGYKATSLRFSKYQLALREELIPISPKPGFTPKKYDPFHDSYAPSVLKAVMRENGMNDSELFSISQKYSISTIEIGDFLFARPSSLQVLWRIAEESTNAAASQQK